jgi:integrase/recombinase XerD
LAILFSEKAMREQSCDGLTLFGPHGHRKYLNAAERRRFLESAQRLPPIERSFCLTLAWSGGRISEILAVTAAAIDIESGAVSLETLKRRRRGVVRQVPLPPAMLDELDRVFDLHTAQRDPALATMRLWRFGRTTAWRYVKAVMASAAIIGMPAMPKGLRHGFGVHAVQAKVPVSLVQRWLGHASLRTTSIYIDVTGPDERVIAALMWYRRDAHLPPVTGIWTRMYAFLKVWRERRKQAAADAEVLMARLGAEAYQEARSRAREARKRAVIDGNRPDQHWDRVRRIIGRKAGRDQLDPATRYLGRK